MKPSAVSATTVIIGLIDGIRMPLVVAAVCVFARLPLQWLSWLFPAYLLLSACLMALGHWYTIRSENDTATGQALRKEKDIYDSIDLPIDVSHEPHRQPTLVQKPAVPALQVGLFFLAGGLLVYLPLLMFSPPEKALLASTILSLLLLLGLGWYKAAVYGVSRWMEMVRTALLPLVAICLLYAITRAIA